MLLAEISVCFSMAIYNKKYLNKTETIAITDSLTGLSNRLAFKKDIAMFDEKASENFACIYIDVNELHIMNNQYGHAAGDGMLLFIANALKTTFSGSYIYRIGGDEFLVFAENIQKDEVYKKINSLKSKIEEKNYYISVGMDFRVKNLDTEQTVSEAEKRMYVEKAEFYQKKEQRNVSKSYNRHIEQTKTGIRDFDAFLSIMSLRYVGVYCVSLKTDIPRQILMPAYLKQFSENETYFSKIFSLYIREMVHSDYQRPLLSFLEYDVLKRQLAEGNIPSISYLKNSSEKFRLSVYPLADFGDEMPDTIWVFEKEF